MKDEHVLDQLEDLIPQGRPLPPEVRVHLQGCAACREEARTLRLLREGLTQSAPEVMPPADLKERVLGEARQVQRRRAQPWWFAAAGVAAALALGALLPGRLGTASAAELRDPAVVVAYGDSLVVANNGAAGAALNLVDGRGRVFSIVLDTPRAAWFTEGVRAGNQVYLADAGNDRVVVLNMGARRVVSILPVRGGIAGLAVQGERVWGKTVSGELLELGGRARRLAPGERLPLLDVMDAVVLQGDQLFVTHHARGEVYLLDAGSLRTRRVVQGLGSPVALAALRGGVLVLDHLGRLIWLNRSGDVTRRVQVPGRPDKLVLSGNRAYLSDRAGNVTSIDLVSGTRQSRAFTKPMDLAVMEDGHVALADAEGGVKILDQDLNVTRQYAGQE